MRYCLAEMDNSVDRLKKLITAGSWTGLEQYVSTRSSFHIGRVEVRTVRWNNKIIFFQDLNQDNSACSLLTGSLCQINSMVARGFHGFKQNFLGATITKN